MTETIRHGEALHHELSGVHQAIENTYPIAMCKEELRKLNAQLVTPAVIVRGHWYIFEDIYPEESNYEFRDSNFGLQYIQIKPTKSGSKHFFVLFQGGWSRITQERYNQIVKENSIINGDY